MRDAIYYAEFCAANETWYDGCENLTNNLPQLHKRAASTTVRSAPSDPIWNYGISVDNHWPLNYVKDNMWDMTHYDYDDTPFDKAYKYHMDNNLPNLDKASLIRPQNIIAFPVFKGLGYSMVYNETFSHPKFAGKKGWWSDNLQNRDNTVMAGQPESNDVSVGRPESIPTGWIEITQLKNVSTSDLNTALGNIYTCEFNRHRVRVDPTSTKISHVQNIYQNNIVPIDPTLDKYDPRLTNYACNLSKPQYGAENISQFPNFIATQTSRDWLYFAANLRGGAREAFNVLYTLDPVPTGRREGITKVQDGGRFTYWNPCCGPNAYLIVDNPVQVAIAKRVDLTVYQEMFPTYTNTYDSYVYQLVTIKDLDEINRKWTLPIYYNYHGYGDSAVSVYVGGALSTKCILQPGESSLAKIEFQNNAGFDWNMYGSAINFTYIESKPINANDLLFRLVHTIQSPISYNFMTVVIPDYLKPWVSVNVSNHMIDVAPLFFDFDNINIVTIRDGFKGVYFYNLSISESFPDSLRGKMHSISIKLNPQHFDALPGMPTDPTGIHDYNLTVPDIMFGVPFGSNSPYEGSIFHTWGAATNLQWSHRVSKAFTVLGARTVTDDDVQSLRGIIGQQDDTMRQKMEEFWSNMTDYTTIPFTTTDLDTVVYAANYNLSVLDDQSLNRFPLPRQAAPDVAVVSFLVRSYAPTLNNGLNLLTNDNCGLF
jgi:hypothetical protein